MVDMVPRVDFCAQSVLSGDLLDVLRTEASRNGVSLHEEMSARLWRTFPRKRYQTVLPVMRRLAQSRGQWVSMGELIDFCFGDEEDGGPDRPDKNIRNAIWQLRHLHGAEIETSPHKGGGYRLNDLTARIRKT